MSYKVKLATFEGPFDLLVYLIENAQMNIYDIQISDITNQYLSYIHEMKDLDIGVTSEFMVLASVLIEIKSKMILPRMNIEGQVVEMEDPRSELVERLLEYKKFKKAATILEQQSEYMENIFEKPQEDISEYLNSPDEYLSLDINKFVKAFDLFLTKKQREEEVKKHYTRIERDKASLESRIDYIKGFFVKGLDKIKKTFSLKELVPKREDKYDVVVTFVAVLQMMRDRILDADQKSLYGNIEVKEYDEEAYVNEQ